VQAVLRVHHEVVEAVCEWWQVKSFMAQVRLGALTLGQLGSHVATLPRAGRAALVSLGDELLAAGREAVTRTETRGRRIGPEGQAWLARAEAEHLRLRWRSGIETPAEGDLLSAWERAVAGFAQFPHVLELARSRARLATVLRALGRTAEARAHADPAREAAHRLRATPTLAELHAAGASAQRTETSAATLTPREHEILGLVAQGRSNGEIARQLYISTKTVSVHVSNILAKLGAAGRTEAAALARQRGLID